MRQIIIIFSSLLGVLIILPAAVMWERLAPAERSGGYTLPLRREAEEQDLMDKRIYGLTDLSTAGDIYIKVYHPREQQVVEMNLEVYLAGVVAAEMPTSFSGEALKAQAVAARTYALKKSRIFGGPGCSCSGSLADICTDSTHCQAWKDTAAEPEKYRRVYRAVWDTAGEVITYNDELINSCYHSTCGGRTEDAAALWAGSELPYLKSKECNFCRHSPHYRTKKTVTHEEAALLNPEDGDLPVFASAGETAVEIEELTPGKRVSVLRLGDRRFTGSEARALFNLPSAAFSVQLNDEGLLFQNSGFGHGAGLCQYGADGMGKRGFGYREIIRFYYPGVNIKALYSDVKKEPQ